jgi:hypothetical protein
MREPQRILPKEIGSAKGFNKLPGKEKLKILNEFKLRFRINYGMIDDLETKI